MKDLEYVTERDGSKWVEYEHAVAMADLLRKAKEVMLRTYDVTDHPADGNTDCDKCAAEIDALLDDISTEWLNMNEINSRYVGCEIEMLMSDSSVVEAVIHDGFIRGKEPTKVTFEDMRKPTSEHVKPVCFKVVKWGEV